MAEWTEAKCRLCLSPLFQRYLLINFTYHIISIICTGRGWRPVSGAIVPDFRQGRGWQHRLQGVHDSDRHDEQRRPRGEAALGLQDVRQGWVRWGYLVVCVVSRYSDLIIQIVCRYRESLSTMFAGEIDVDEMVEIFSLMYTVQVGLLAFIILI